MTINDASPPPLVSRIVGVWLRHVRVYAKNLVSNGFPPFIEPLIFLVGMGVGLGAGFQLKLPGVSGFVQFLAAGLLVTTAMFTSAYECTFGTFIRLEFDHAYDGMLAAPMTPVDLILGEILWTGTKGLFFSSAVLIVITAAGVIRQPLTLLIPAVGFATGCLFGAISLFVTSFVKNINHFNFYFTGFISPMFFFSGVIAPVDRLPPALRVLAEFFPLTHPVRISQAACFGWWRPLLVWDALYLVGAVALFSWLAIARLKKRLID